MECVETVGMHLYFYLITTCFVVLPKMCETTKTLVAMLGSGFGNGKTQEANPWSLTAFPRASQNL